MPRQKLLSNLLSALLITMTAALALQGCSSPSKASDRFETAREVALSDLELTSIDIQKVAEILATTELNGDQLMRLHPQLTSLKDRLTETREALDKLDAATDQAALKELMQTDLKQLREQASSLLSQAVLYS